MAVYHTKENGEPGKCTATKIGCPLSGPHFESPDEVIAYNEKRFEQEFNTLGGLTKPKKNNRKVAAIVDSIVDRNGSEFRKGYVKSIDDKHFTAGGHGSKFTDPRVTKAEDVLQLALQDRGSLAGDDREKLIALGSPREAFIDGVRYLKVNVSGVEALKSTTEMADDELVTVRAKGKSTPERPSSLTFVAKVKTQAATSHATIIIGANPDEPSKEVLWTMFPGQANSAPKSDSVREAGFEDGDQVTVKQLRERFGDFKVNTEML